MEKTTFYANSEDKKKVKKICRKLSAKLNKDIDFSKYTRKAIKILNSMSEEERLNYFKNKK